jgi:hypothetical protein
MGPELMIASALLGAGATAYSAHSSKQMADAEAEAGEQKARIESIWAKRRADEETASAQRGAGEELRKAELAKGVLTARAGASGSGASDPTVMDLMGDIDKEGAYNAAQVTAAGQQKVAGIDYQSSLDRWTADTSARVKRYGGKATLIGGLLSAGGQAAGGYANASRMAQRYPDESADSRKYRSGY